MQRESWSSNPPMLVLRSFSDNYQRAPTRFYYQWLKIQLSHSKAIITQSPLTCVWCDMRPSINDLNPWLVGSCGNPVAKRAWWTSCVRGRVLGVPADLVHHLPMHMNHAQTKQIRWAEDLNGTKAMIRSMMQTHMLALKVLVMHWNTFKQDKYSTVGRDGGCRVGEVRASTISPMPDHKGFKLQ